MIASRTWHQFEPDGSVAGRSCIVRFSAHLHSRLGRLGWSPMAEPLPAETAARSPPSHLCPACASLLDVGVPVKQRYRLGTSSLLALCRRDEAIQPTVRQAGQVQLARVVLAEGSDEQAGCQQVVLNPLIGRLPLERPNSATAKVSVEVAAIQLREARAAVDVAADNGTAEGTAILGNRRLQTRPAAVG